jgi:hypothetical protein
MLSVPKVEEVVRCIGRMMLCTFPGLFPHPTKPESVEFVGVGVYAFVHLDVVDCCPDLCPRGNVHAIAECETIAQNIPSRPDYPISDPTERGLGGGTKAEWIQPHGFLDKRV